MKNTRWFSACLSLVLGVLVALPGVSQGVVPDKDKESIDQVRTELNSKTISLNVKDTPFREVINLFRQHTSFNIVMSEQAEKMLNSASTSNKEKNKETSRNGWNDPFGTEEDQTPMRRGEEQNNPFAPRNEQDNAFARDGQRNDSSGTNTGRSGSSVDPNVTIELNDVRLGQAMKMILNQKNMTAVFKHGVVRIVPENYAESFDTRFYDVRDLLHEMKDFEGPKMDFERISTAGGNNDDPMEGTDDIFVPPEGKEEKNILSNREDFVELVRSNVGNGGWERGGDIQIYSGVMVVHQAPDVHREISHLLTRLRQFR